MRLLQLVQPVSRGAGRGCPTEADLTTSYRRAREIARGQHASGCGNADPGRGGRGVGVEGDEVERVRGRRTQAADGGRRGADRIGGDEDPRTIFQFVQPVSGSIVGSGPAQGDLRIRQGRAGKTSGVVTPPVVVTLIQGVAAVVLPLNATRLN